MVRRSRSLAWGGCIEGGGKALERFSSDAEPGLLDQQLLGGQTSRL